MIKLINLDELCFGLPEITSSKFFTDRDMTQLDPDGLFSETIFGPPNSKEWRTKFAKINLKTKVINPVIFRLLKRMNRQLVDVILTYSSFDIDDNGNIIPDSGPYQGISDVINNWSRLKFPGGTPIRNKLSKYLSDERNFNSMFISNVLVIPPASRPIYNMSNPKDGLMYDELNDYYVKLIKNTSNITPDINEDKILPDSYDLKIQMIVNEFFEYVKLKAGKKKGIMRSQLISKRADFSGRAVIIGNPTLSPDEVGVPFKMAVNLFEPFILHKMINTKKPDWWDQVTEKDLSAYHINVFKTYLSMISKGYYVPDKIYKWIWLLTKDVMKDRYVLCKRDPSIQRESWQGYKPVLVEGNVIQMNSSSVGGHNADFDGDTALCKVSLLIEIKDQTLIEKISSSSMNKLKYTANILDLKDAYIEI